MSPGRLAAAFISLFYPPRCAACDDAVAEGAAFCEPCALTIERAPPGCGRCGLPLVGAAHCLGCLRSSPPFSIAAPPFLFGGALASAIRRLKWVRAPELAGPLGTLIGPAIAASGADLAI